MTPSPPEKTDEEIARLVQAGKKEAFGELVTRYESKMIRYGRKFLFGYEDVEDAVQEVFIKAYRNIQSFDATKKLSSWLYRIAHNEFINTIKKKGKEPLPFFDADTLFPHPVSPEKSDQQTHLREAKEMIESCLSKLTPKYREILILYYLEELSYKEIADVLRVPMATVGVRLKRGRETLQSICQKQGFKL